MRCDVCVLEDEAARDIEVSALCERLATCDECPLEQGERGAAWSSEAGALLVRRLRGAADLVRRQQRELKKARNEAREMRELSRRGDERIAKLEELQKASTREADAELRAKMDLVAQKQAAILALSTPILHVHDGVLVLPLVGALDDARAEGLTSGLLREIAATGARFAILDLTGIADLDRRAAEILVKVALAVRLLGARVLLSGLRPGVAREIVGLDVGLGALTTARSLEDALHRCGVG